MPRVSILIPVFNRKKYIAQCIQSALGQTFTDHEIVVVDNASEDGTWEICKCFAVQDPRVRVFRNETNIGPVRNWLRCLDEAKGQYGKFLFSDDLVMPEFLAATLPHLEDPSVAFVSTAALIGDSIDNGVTYYSIQGQCNRLSKSEYFENLASHRKPVPFSPGAAIFRISDLRAHLILQIPVDRPHDFLGNGAGPDVLLFALTALHYKTVVMLQAPLVFFRTHDGSFTVANAKNSVSDGYRLALAWFFRKKLTRRLWATWIARNWLLDIYRAQRILSPLSFSRRYESRVNILEVLLIVLMSTKIVVGKVISSISQFHK